MSTVGAVGVQVKSLLVVDVELIAATFEHPMAVAVTVPGRFVPEIVKVESLPKMGVAALTALTVAGGGAVEPEPQAVRASTLIARPTAMAVDLKSVFVMMALDDLILGF
jgi:hypothetical protein